MSEMDENEFEEQKEDIGFGKRDVQEGSFSEEPDTNRGLMRSDPA